jgi:predicted nuclease with TOPRIM domain
MSQDPLEPLEECQERVHELEEENSLLKESASTFGHLAERLRARLEEVRRPAEQAPAEPRRQDDQRTTDEDRNPS